MIRRFLTLRTPNAIGRVLLFYAIYAAILGIAVLLLPRIAPGLNRELGNVQHFLSTPSISLTVVRLLTVVVVLVATAIMARVDSRTVLSFGLGGVNALTKFSIGVAVGIVVISVVVGLLEISGNFVVEGWALHVPEDILKYGCYWASYFVLVSILEESLYRGYALQTLARSIGFWPASSIASVLFALGHLTNTDESVIGIVQVMLAGLIWCAGLQLTGSLWWSIGFHAAWDWAQSFLYGTADSGTPSVGCLINSRPSGADVFSGGRVGPEGSVACVLVQLAMLIIMIALAIHRARD